MALTLAFCVTLPEHFSSLGLSFLLRKMPELDSSTAGMSDRSVLRAGVKDHATTFLRAGSSLRSLPKQRLFQAATPSRVRTHLPSLSDL